MTEIERRRGLPFYQGPAVYKARNKVNGKEYVGSAAKNLWRRLNNHVNELNRGEHPNVHLQRAWNKHGADAFEWIVLEPCTSETATEREQFWIDELDVFKNGYNRCPKAGSRLGTKHSEETKQLISDKKKGKTFSAEVRANMSAERKERFKDPEERKKCSPKVHWSKGPNAENIAAKISNAQTGKQLPEEVKQAISATKKAQGKIKSDERQRLADEAQAKVDEERRQRNIRLFSNPHVLLPPKPKPPPVKLPDATNELIRPAVGFPGYFIGKDGTPWSAWKTRGAVGGRNGKRWVESFISDELQPMKVKVIKGRGYIRLRRDGNYVSAPIHHLVEEAFG